MNKLLLLLIIIPAFVKAQLVSETNNSEQAFNKGIKWTEGLNWEEIKEKARKENKYIFLDCFATWCGPCKLMDKNVYTKQQIGNLLNQKFISVRVQMDQTKNDVEQVKNWYTDAAVIKKK